MNSSIVLIFRVYMLMSLKFQDTERAKQQIQKVLKRLNDHLLTRTFLVGERVTLADISVVNNLQSLYELVN